MFFSKAVLRPGAARSAAYQRLVADAGHAAHRLAWSLFADAPNRDRDFVFRWDDDRPGGPVLHAVSDRKPEPSADGLFDVQTKPYDPQLQAGQPLAFRLRANPVVKKRDANGKQRVHDVVMNAKHEMKQAGTWSDCDLTEAQLVKQEGAQWLRRRTDSHRRDRDLNALYGFDLDEDCVRAEAHRKHSFRKSGSGRSVTFTTMDFSGRLKVTTPDRFRKRALFSGVGPSKAYGCGLLMVRPVQ
jgi:CRISPR system Cascade subunit CasE